MDRSWRDKATNPLDDEGKTRWEKFKEGGYSIKNVGKKFAGNLAMK